MSRFLFARLAWNARVLKERLDFEQLIAAISTRFISTPLHRIPDEIAEGLARLVEHSGVDRAQIIIGDGRNTEFPSSLSISSSTEGERGFEFEELLDFTSNWSLKEYENQICIHAPSVD